ncbi:MAG: hypothetical protein U9R15_21320 [Chloroflexota bacterium]|nr:hypothetical protein [Chloroflexota bacterium]
MLEVGYLTNKQGQPKAVVIPIKIWKQLFPSSDASAEVESESLTERMEDYCLSKAMDEAQESPLLNREEALAYLGE